MDKICIVLCYYGTFPSTFQSYLNTCGSNESIDWLIVTDINIQQEFKCPENVRQLNMKLTDIEKLACEKLKIKVSIDKPYKLCDYKVAYGLLFEDYLAEYDWWGYGDCDVLYGNLRKFFNHDRLQKYDKIYSFGHLCIIRNDNRCKMAFTLSAKDSYDWKDVFYTQETMGWDEHNGINLKMEAHGFNIDHSVEYIDRSTLSARFRTVDYKDVELYFVEPWVKKLKFLKNYSAQVFAYEDGATYQIYSHSGKIIRNEVCYIHYRHRYTIESCGEYIYIGANKWLSEKVLKQLSEDEIKRINAPQKYETLCRMTKYMRDKMDRLKWCENIIIVGKKIKRVCKRFFRK